MIETQVDNERVVDWRLQWLLHAGYSKKNAIKIAEAMEIDWHFASDLRGRCTDEKLCMRILFGGGSAP